MDLDALITQASCLKCKKILRDPRSLPCGNSVCFECTEDLNDVLCSICNLDHQVPANGFPQTIQLAKICEFVQAHQEKENIKKNMETMAKEAEMIISMSNNFLNTGKF
jgi:hypothetical protein